MKSSKKILSGRYRLYIVVIGLCMICLVFDWISNQPEPKTIRLLDTSSEGLQTIWVKKIPLWTYFSDWSTNTIYLTDSTPLDYFIALDSLTGSTKWKIFLGESDRFGDFTQFGPRFILTNDQTVFTVTSTHVNAYHASSGELYWWTELGYGHVSIYVQREDPFLRIYYGDKIFEVSQDSGEIVSSRPKGDIVWIQKNIEVHCPLSSFDSGAAKSCWIGLTGIDPTTGQTLWKNNYAHFSDYYQEQSISNLAFAGFSEDGICVLNVETGEHTWCLPAGKISNIAIDASGKVGYFLRYDFSLVKINLLTGGILAETKFLPKVLPTEMQQRSYGYKVAITKDTVIVSFGDSDQTFGLKINP